MYVSLTTKYLVQRIFDESHTKCDIDERKIMMVYRIKEVYNKWIILIRTM